MAHPTSAADDRRGPRRRGRTAAGGLRPVARRRPPVVAERAPARRWTRRLGQRAGAVRARPRASPTSPRSASPATPASVRAAIEQHRAGLDADTHGYLAANESTLDDAVAGAAASTWTPTADQIALHRLDHDGPRPALLGTAAAPGRRGAHHRARLLRHARVAAAARGARRRHRSGGSGSTTSPEQADAGRDRVPAAGGGQPTVPGSWPSPGCTRAPA